MQQSSPRLPFGGWGQPPWTVVPDCVHMLVFAAWTVPAVEVWSANCSQLLSEWVHMCLGTAAAFGAFHRGRKAGPERCPLLLCQLWQATRHTQMK